MKLSSLNKGLVLHCPLSEERYNPATKRVDDLTPYENHGTATNAANFAADRMGHSGMAMEFNGLSDYVYCGNDDSLDTAESFTYSFWMYHNARTIGGVGQYQYSQFILTKGIDSTSGHKAFYWTYNGMFNFTQRFNDNSKINHSINRSNIPLQTWTYITCVYNSDDNEMIVYVNGVEVISPSSTAGKTCTTTTHQFAIAKLSATGLYFFDGSLADVRVYNHALSQPEITLLYKQYNSKVII